MSAAPRIPWRRCLPTIGMAAEFGAAEMLALGDWQDKSLVDRKDFAAMPLCYADKKHLMPQQSMLRCVYIPRMLMWEILMAMGRASRMSRACPRSKRCLRFRPRACSRRMSRR